MSIDPIALACALINCPSVTPASGAVFDVLEEALRPLGFTVHRFTQGEPPDGPTENMVAIRGDGGPHFGFAGHLDVVPAGDGWPGDAFEARIEDGLLIGRGANDMKSAIAALFTGRRSRFLPSAPVVCSFLLPSWQLRQPALAAGSAAWTPTLKKAAATSARTLLSIFIADGG